eukprot:TRINITY_DN8413_c0_g1_i2.p1 TRINITY_DN8413_c0_g1~~TRINITY_DN8413_c0_g1_i2.p1  ORF type:complete len:238 (+),score=32.10 TRINITY_DN8413_c0_g1_i2:399-1112(+)
MTLLRLSVILYLLLRLADFCIWGYNSRIMQNCSACDLAQMFFLVFPLVVCVLIFKLCVVVWYNLILAISRMNAREYHIGRNIYIVMGVIYLIGAVILMVLMIINLNLSVSLALFWIILPLIGSLIHSFIQVFRVNSTLKKDLSEPSTRHAYQKNIIFGALNIAYTILILLIVSILAYGGQYRVDWWYYLLFFFFLHVDECLIIFLYFLFSRQYAFTSPRNSEESKIVDTEVNDLKSK